MGEKQSISRARLKIYGRVQGVGFRFYVHRKASAVGLGGWVRNANGFVEVVLEGPPEKVKACIEDCRKGPMFSKVDHIETNEEKPTGEFARFEIR